MKQIPLTQGQFSLVDDCDFEYLNQWEWQALLNPHTKSFYACRNIYLDNGKRTTIKMHRVILGLTDPNIHTDHKNHDTLDNRRGNIRAATCGQNRANGVSRKNSSSQYLGVFWHKKNNKWTAAIKKNGILKYLGSFDSEENAAKKYDQAAIKIHGEFANLNFALA